MKRLLSIIISINLLIFTTGCQKKNEEKIEIKKENSIPKELIAITETIDNMEKDLFKIREEDKKTDKIQADKEKEQMIKNVDEGKSEKKDSKEDTEDDKKSKVVETHKEKLVKMWTSLETQTEASHKQLNNYKIKAIEDRANEKDIKEFEENLNNLTVFIENKDILNSFISNNQIYNNISYFLSLYEDYKYQTIKLKHYVNNIYIYGLKNEWDKALEGMDTVEGQYSEVLKEFNKKAKEKPSKEDKTTEKDLEKLKYSIDSLKQSLNKEDIKLLEIKRDVIISNIEKVNK